ncbi:MAG: hypothetical protein PHI66_03540 [Candidatus Pacebacteria bacterium]|nr:hypothetical protein [Candidatus Paceibacterota bacterium]
MVTPVKASPRFYPFRICAYVPSDGSFCGLEPKDVFVVNSSLVLGDPEEWKIEIFLECQVVTVYEMQMAMQNYNDRKNIFPSIRCKALERPHIPKAAISLSSFLHKGKELSKCPAWIRSVYDILCPLGFFRKLFKNSRECMRLCTETGNEADKIVGSAGLKEMIKGC